MNDTSPKMAEKMREMIRNKTPIERAKMGSSMYDTSKQLVMRAIFAMNPNISATQLKQEIFLKFYRNDFSPSECLKILKHFEQLCA